MSIGDVVRVVLLFYLMPLWAVLLARLLLGELTLPLLHRATLLAWLRVALALCWRSGAGIVLWPERAAAAAGRPCRARCPTGWLDVWPAASASR